MAPAPQHRVPPSSGISHGVAQGENLQSIAFLYGHAPGYLWDHEKNAELRSQRRDPNVLMPGDTIFIPGLRPREEPAVTGKRHTFRRKGVPSLFRFRALVHDRPLANQDCKVEIDGTVFLGKTDEGGLIQCPVRPDAAAAKVTVGTEPFVWTFDISLRTVDPVTEPSGLQGRLANLGLFRDTVDGVLGASTFAALRAFQFAQGLETTGQPDAATRERLVIVHGS